MKVSRNVRLLIHILESFLTTWALMKAARLEPGNILTGVFFLLSFFLYRRIHHRIKDMPFMRSLPAARNALILSLMFSLMYMLVDGHHYIEQLTSRLYQGIILLSVFAGFTILFTSCCCSSIRIPATGKCCIIICLKTTIPADSFPAVFHA